jgi:hypothetical protein
VRVIVLGGGLQGVCTSLELASRGIDVDLVERDPGLVNRASLRNEGKVHLGLVYARDTTLRTGTLMLRGALSFGRLLSEWTRGGSDRVQVSRSFCYLVANESQSPVPVLAAYYEALDSRYRREMAENGADYLGRRHATLCRPVPADRIDRRLNRERVAAAFETIEASVKPGELARALRQAVASNPRIRLCLNHCVNEVARTSSGFACRGVREDAVRFVLEGDQVVNALWEGRLAIDDQLGLRPERPWVHRLKVRILVELPAHLRSLPSVTFVLGPFGDVVSYEHGPACVSWYPECLAGWSHDLQPPFEWNALCRGEVPGRQTVDRAHQALSAFDRWVPGLCRSRILTVDAGVIFAWGQTDISDPESGLHRRSAIGPRSTEGYHSIDTGKLTMAPLFAVLTADRVAGGRGPRSRAADRLDELLG